MELPSKNATEVLLADWRRRAKGRWVDVWMYGWRDGWVDGCVD